MAFEEHKAELVLAQAFSFYSPETVCFELLQKALSQIGNGWYTSEVSVQQEHFASALALRRLDTLLAAVPSPTRSGRIIIGCPPGENHTFGPLLVTLLLRRRGWHVVYLGADVPITRLHATIASTRPDIVVFSAQLL
jgi:methanogenic corrinoid protein MtbC1